MKKGRVFLIPSLLGEEAPMQSLAVMSAPLIRELRFFVAENAKHLRRFIKQSGLDVPLQEIEVNELNEHTSPQEISPLLDPARKGQDIGIISEAGCPGVADPGAALVRLAHKEGIRVIPVPGPSSILLALMASGMNGQQFAFAGYLPKESSERSKKIKELEQLAQKGSTQLFMDTPYRNDHVLEDLLKNCNGSTQLLVACDLTLPSEFIRTQSINEWKKTKISFHKRPLIFALGK